MDLKGKIKENVINYVNANLGSSFKFREHQLDAIIDIIYNIVFNDDNTSTYVCEAPTGSGKSLIILISAGVLHEFYDKTSYILVSDLFLWKQYADFIKANYKLNFGYLKGQTGNYKCLLNNEDIRNSDCKISKVSWHVMMTKQAWQKYGYECAKKCEYVKSRKKAIKSGVTLLTYQLFMYVINVLGNNKTNIFQHRDIIFCDECHNIPSIVQNQYSVCVTKDNFENLEKIYKFNKSDELNLFSQDNSLEEFEIFDNYPTWLSMKNKLNVLYTAWKDENTINEINAEYMSEYSKILYLFEPLVTSMEDKISNKKQESSYLSKDEINVFKICTWFHNYCCHWNDLITSISDTGPKYLVKQINYKDKKCYISFNCAKEDFIVNKYLLSQATHKVLLSATVGGIDAFSDNIGMKYTNEKEINLNKIPSTFDFSKSPIYYLNKFKMNYSEKDKSLPILKNVIYSIVGTKFKNEKGIIQTGSYSIAKDVYENAPSEIKHRILLYNDSKEKTECIKMHQIYDNSILIGPSLNEGIDLPDTGCRFIIILKVPYPSLADKLVKVKIKLFPLWYNSTTSNEIIQGIGRGVRNKDDYCTTYILDACFDYLYKQTKQQYPVEIQNRIKYI